VGIAFVGTLLLMRFLAPLIGQVLEQVGNTPSLPTRLIMLIGSVGSSWAFLAAIVLAAIVAAWGLPRLLAMGPLRRWWERVSLYIPLIGTLLRKAWMVRVARCLSSLLSAGLPLVRTIELTADATGNSWLGQSVLREAAAGVQKGETLSQALPPRMMSRAFVGMLSVGETSGTMAEMLERVADIHEVEVGAGIDAIFRAMEPVMMAMVGGVVLVCLLCTFQPLYTLAMQM
jgi:type II secretory pathway component PulF